MKYTYRQGDRDHEVELLTGDGGLRALLNGAAFELLELDREQGELHFEVNGEVQHVDWAKAGRDVWLHVNGRSYHLEKSAGGGGAAGRSGFGERVLRTPMPGQVREVLVKTGQTVEAGDVLLLLEAMKMEIRIQAPRAGAVAQVAVAAGESVEKDQILVELDGEDA